MPCRETRALRVNETYKARGEEDREQHTILGQHIDIKYACDDILISVIDFKSITSWKCCTCERSDNFLISILSMTTHHAAL